MPQLDTLRAFAVFAVLIHHLLDFQYLPGYLANIDYGLLGVRLFFVLSGFLITGILLQSRKTSEKRTTTTRIFAARQFYIRRILRIFPIYYAVIIIALICGVSVAQRDWFWLITYTYNIHICIQGWMPAYFAHFWTLAVEEQFYIVWPWIVLFVPRKLLIPLVACIICLGPLYRLYAYLHLYNGVVYYCFTFSSLDALGIGSLLAIARAHDSFKDKLTRISTFYILPLAIFTALALKLMAAQRLVKILHMMFFEFSVSIVFSCIIWSAANRIGGIGRIVMETKVLMYLGKISYGIYIYHELVPHLILPCLQFLGINIEPKGLLEFCILTVTTILIASASWHLFESPINRLKRHFH